MTGISYPLLTNGAIGTMLMLGYGISAPEVQDVTRREPQLLLTLYRRYIAAGSNAIVTNTISMNCVSAPDLCNLSMDICRQIAEEADDDIRIIGTIGPMADSRTAGAMARTMRDADLIMVETATSLRGCHETVANIRDSLPDKPLIVSATAVDGRHLPDGTDICEWAEAMRPFNAIVGLNCGTDSAVMCAAMEYLASHHVGPLYFAPSAGTPELPEPPELWAARVNHILASCNIAVAGGCCNTSPAHIAMISDFRNRV